MTKFPADLLKPRSQWRTELIAQRLAMSQAERFAATQAISYNLSDLIQQQVSSVKTIGVYMPHRGEVDLRGWMAIVDFQEGITLALPVAPQAAAPLQFARFRIGDPLINDSFGISVPLQQDWVIPDVLLIPCVGFTRDRMRLGYGGGYYDRTLAYMQPKPIALGIAFSCQECSFLAQEHDVPLDAIINEKGVV